MADKATRAWVEDQLFALLGSPPPDRRHTCRLLSRLRTLLHAPKAAKFPCNNAIAV